MNTKCNEGDFPGVTSLDVHLLDSLITTGNTVRPVVDWVTLVSRHCRVQILSTILNYR